MSNAITVRRFIINDDAKKTQKALIKKCDVYLYRYMLRGFGLAILSILLSLVISGTVRLRDDLILLLLILFAVFILCVMYLTDLRQQAIPIGFVRLLRLYMNLNDTTYDKVEQILSINDAYNMLVGKRLIEIVRSNNVHHVSLTSNGILSFLFSDGIEEDNMSSFKVDTNLVKNNTDSVDILVDACYIRAIPCLDD